MRVADTSVAAASCVACGTELYASRCTRCGSAAMVRDYQVTRVLSEQPHSRVYLATAANGAPVVLKELAFSLVPNAQTLEAFQREAELLRQLSHPRLPTFIDAFQEGEGVDMRLYLVMSYVEGRSLLEEVETHRFNEAEVLDIAAQALELLVYLHGLSPLVIHRDVKPANLLRRPDGTIALVDFGAAREVQRAATSGQATLVGTLGYMPPEQLVGVTTPSSDVYALGATLVHLLSRKPPTELMGEDLTLEFRKLVNLRPPTLRFLERLVHRSPRKRFASAAQALAALEAIRSGKASRKRALMLVGGGVGVVGTLAVGALVLLPLVEKLHASEASEAKAEAPQGNAAQPAAAAKVGTPLDLTCPAGTTLVEDLKKHSRWCSQMSASGHPVRHGPFVRWNGEGELVERSTYFDDKLHGPQAFFNDGQKTSEGERREGKKVGLWTTYSTSGNYHKEREETYKDEVLDGPWRGFNYNGALEEEGTYADGQKHGVWTRYDNGQKKSETTYSHGKQHGPHISWHRYDKIVYEKGEYVDGEKMGPWVKYHSNGNKESEGSVIRNVPDGAWSTWHSNGQQTSQGTYEKGTKVGLWITWFSNGQKESEVTWGPDRTQVGTSTNWHENGQKRSEYIQQPNGMTRASTWYSNGQLESQGVTKGRDQEGPWTFWHQNGKKRSFGVFKNGKQEGLSTTWYDNGRKEREGRYVHGSQMGTWRLWDREGKLKLAENFPRR